MGGISALEMQSSITMETAINSYNSNFEKLLASNFILDSPTTYVVFSDNHEISEYGTQDYSTWFKGGLNFETLRLAFSDPESRVHTDKKEPLSNPLFKGIKIASVIKKSSIPVDILLAAPYFASFFPSSELTASASMDAGFKVVANIAVYPALNKAGFLDTFLKIF